MENKIKQYEKAAMLFKVVGWLTLVMSIFVVINIIEKYSSLNKLSWLGYNKNLLSSGDLIFPFIFAVIGIVFVILGGEIKKRKQWARELGRVLGFILFPIYPFGILIYRYLGEDWDKYVKSRVT